MSHTDNTKGLFKLLSELSSAVASIATSQSQIAIAFTGIHKKLDERFRCLENDQLAILDALLAVAEEVQDMREVIRSGYSVQAKDEEQDVLVGLAVKEELVENEGPEDEHKVLSTMKKVKSRDGPDATGSTTKTKMKKEKRKKDEHQELERPESPAGQTAKTKKRKSKKSHEEPLLVEEVEPSKQRGHKRRKRELDTGEGEGCSARLDDSRPSKQPKPADTTAGEAQIVEDSVNKDRLSACGTSSTLRRHTEPPKREPSRSLPSRRVKADALTTALQNIVTEATSYSQPGMSSDINTSIHFQAERMSASFPRGEMDRASAVPRHSGMKVIEKNTFDSPGLVVSLVPDSDVSKIGHNSSNSVDKSAHLEVPSGPRDMRQSGGARSRARSRPPTRNSRSPAPSPRKSSMSRRWSEAPVGRWNRGANWREQGSRPVTRHPNLQGVNHLQDFQDHRDLSSRGGPLNRRFEKDRSGNWRDRHDNSYPQANTEGRGNWKSADESAVWSSRGSRNGRWYS